MKRFYLDAEGLMRVLLSREGLCGCVVCEERKPERVRLVTPRSPCEPQTPKAGGGRRRGAAWFSRHCCFVKSEPGESEFKETGDAWHILRGL